ncbi:hypothetical protein Cme02nite_69300 [Catellatospora methionotrophica]|uniref:HNH nuclease domain-containing protein n=1 Tax=Catellatospora methionotrophica TaxID=121620 RepID=A0A8J3LHV4_9ACTN|nr:HNH endonuclease signature motif containing protein [Catellatospora methionotrophica]GIG18598.1 hypothetical protein Cme02nite_69300 [Catellatospora methionotrophica]
MSKEWRGGSDTRWRAFRAAILARDRYTCQIQGKGCTKTAPLDGGHVDHIVLLSMGGQKYDPANCRAACQACNLARKKAQPQHEPPPKRVSSW